MRDKLHGSRWRRRKAKKSRASGFSFVELLTVVAVLSILMTLIFSAIDGMGKIMQGSKVKVQSFQRARIVFESIGRKIGQATLNTYWDYDPPLDQIKSGEVPKQYIRYSELHFISGAAKTLIGSGNGNVNPGQAVFFQAPLGMSSVSNLPTLLNALGYYVEFGDDGSNRPTFFPNPSAGGPSVRYRYRLMEFSQMAENLSVYQSGGYDWFQDNLATASNPLAENVILLAVLPMESSQKDPEGDDLAPDFLYDSRLDNHTPGTSQPDTAHQLPPLVELIMVTIDETSAARLQGNSQTAPLQLGLEKLFLEAAKRDEDIQTLEDILNAKAGNQGGNTIRMKYRIFRTKVTLSGWIQVK